MLKLKLQYFANDIAGLSIGINADTVDFDKGLKQVNKELAATGNLGKETDKALKFDPTSLEKMTDSLKVTTKQLEGSKEKAQSLNKEIERLSKLDVDDLNASAKNLQQELNDSKSRTSELQSELKKLEKIDIDSEEYANLSQALKDSQNESAKLSTELKVVNKDIKNLDYQNMTKLATEAKKADNEIERLEVKQKNLNNNIEAMNTSNYDKLTGGAKKAAQQQGLLTQELKDTNEEVSDTTGALSGLASTGASDVFNELTESLGPANAELVNGATNAVQMGASMSGLGPIGIAAGAGIGILTSALTYNIREVERNRESTKDLVYTFGEIEDSSGNAAESVTNLSKAYEISSEEVSQALKSSSKWNKEMELTDSRLRDVSNSVALNNSGILDYNTQLSLTTSAQRNWNLSSSESKDLLGTTTSLMSDYGKVMEDLPDTITEWSDTFAAAGIDAETFYDILVAGAESGARSTDEVANALNEFVLKISEAKDPTSDAALALSELGFSFDEINTIISEQGIDVAIGLILDQMANLTDNQTELNDLLIISGALFGTVGEEYIANAVKLGELGTATEDLTEAQLFLKDNTNLLTEALELQKSSLTTEQYDNAKFAIDNLTLSSFLFSDNIYNAMLPALQGLVESGALTQEQLDLLSASQTTLSQAMATGSIDVLLQKANVDTLTTTMTTYKTQLGLTDEQIKKYSDTLNLASESSNLLKLDTEKVTTAFWNTLEANERLGQTVAITTQNANGYGATTKQVTLEQIKNGEVTLIQNQEMEALRQTIGKTTLNQDVMAESVKTLTNENATSAEKISALDAVMGELSSATNTQTGEAIVAADKMEAYQKKVDSLKSAQGLAEKASGTYAGSITDTSVDLDDGSKKLDKYGDAVEESSKGFDSFSKKAQNSSDKVKDLNKKANEWDNKNLDKNINVTTTYKTKGTPPTDSNGNSIISQSGLIPVQSINTPSQLSSQLVPFNVGVPVVNNQKISSGININSLSITTNATNVKTLIKDIRREIGKAV